MSASPRELESASEGGTSQLPAILLDPRRMESKLLRLVDADRPLRREVDA